MSVFWKHEEEGEVCGRAASKAAGCMGSSSSSSSTPWCARAKSFQSCPAKLLCPWDSPVRGAGLPCPPPGDLPDPGIEPPSPLTPALVCGFFTASAAWEAPGPWCSVLIPVVRGEVHLRKEPSMERQALWGGVPGAEGFGAQAVRVGAGPEALARGGWRESRRSSPESRRAGSSAEWRGGRGNQSRWQSRAAPWAAQLVAGRPSSEEGLLWRLRSWRAWTEAGAPSQAGGELRSLTRSVTAKETLPYDSMHVSSGMYLIIVFRWNTDEKPCNASTLSPCR